MERIAEALVWALVSVATTPDAATPARPSELARETARERVHVRFSAGVARWRPGGRAEPAS